MGANRHSRESARMRNCLFLATVLSKIGKAVTVTAVAAGLPDTPGACNASGTMKAQRYHTDPACREQVRPPDRMRDVPEDCGIRAHARRSDHLNDQISESREEKQDQAAARLQSDNCRRKRTTCVPSSSECSSYPSVSPMYIPHADENKSKRTEVVPMQWHLPTHQPKASTVDRTLKQKQQQNQQHCDPLHLPSDEDM